MPVGLSRDLPPKRVMRAFVRGQDIVVWRASNGDIAAWDNRCPHRGMSLSHGFVRGNALACLYHGWHYEQSGRCSYIPAHPDLDPPATIHSTRFGVIERDGVIWVDTSGMPKLGMLTEPLDPLRSLIAEASEAVVEAACHHTPFEGGMPQPSDRGLYALGTIRIALLMNPLKPNRAQVTVLTNPGLALDARMALSRWCETLRRNAEGTGTGGA